MAAHFLVLADMLKIASNAKKEKNKGAERAFI